MRTKLTCSPSSPTVNPKNNVIQVFVGYRF